MRNSLLLASLLALTGCGYKDSRMAHQAQINMVGMGISDLQACAGVADKTSKVDDHTQILTYNLKNASSDGIAVTLPVVGGGYTIGNSDTFCNANFQVVNGKVRSLYYSGNNDRTNGEDGVCAPIIRGCMRRPPASMAPLTDEAISKSSAYYQPPAPPAPPPPAPLPLPSDTVVRMPTVGR